MSLLLVNANTLHIPLADKSVHMALTSPPYWGLRSYAGTATWIGGDTECDHEAPPNRTHAGFNERYFGKEFENDKQGELREVYKDTCGKCGAQRIDAQLGLERLHDCGAWSRREIVGFAEIDDWDEDEDAEGNRIFWVKGKKVTPVYGPPESPCGECFICHCRQWVAEVWRVLRDDGTFWLNIGDSYATGTTADRQDGTLNLGAGTNQARKIARNGTPPGLKPKDMCLIPQRLALALQADGWFVRSEIIWCLSHSTRVYAQTQKGEMPMTVGEMVRLKPETVNLWTGKKWARVGEFWQSPDTEGIEIALRSGQRVSCTPGHLWPTERGIVRADQLTLGDRLLSVQLPEPKEPKRPGGIPDRFGWVMGFYLAEGSTLKGDGLQFAMRSDENDEAERLHEFAEYYGSSFTLFDYGNKRNVHILGGAAGAIVHEYISNGDCKHKHLTTATWQRSNEFIHLLLLGYLAGDGYNDEKNNRWRLGFARNDALADDLRTIGARLDVSIRLKRTWNKNQTGKFYGWRGEVRFGSERRTSDTEIVGLQKSKSERFYDISIEDPHVFALSCGVLTHNSKPNPMPESVTDRPTKSHETVWLLAKAQRYYYDQEAVREEAIQPGRLFKGEWTKFEGDEVNDRRIRITHDIIYPSARNRRDVWQIATAPYSGAKMQADYVGDDGKPYKVSPDCPIHGRLSLSQKFYTGEYDGQSNQSQPRIPGNGSDPASKHELSSYAKTSRNYSEGADESSHGQNPENIDDCKSEAHPLAHTSGAQTLSRTSHTQESDEPQGHKMDLSCPSNAQIASENNKQTHRTDPAPLTSEHDTASAQTLSRTQNTSLSDAQSDSVDHTTESNSEADDLSGSHKTQKASRNGRKLRDKVSSLAFIFSDEELYCTCEQVSSDHFATWPRALVEPMIKAGTSEAGCCSKCGRQWERVVASESHYEKRQARDDPFRMPQVDSSGWRPPTKIDHGFRPSCACYPRADEWEEYPAFEDKNHPTAAELAEHERIRKLRAELLALFATYDSVPCTVLDPFAGSGTTLLVARKLGRKAIGLDLSYSYLHDQARARLSLDALDEWEHGKKDGKVLTDLPLFANQTEID